MRGFEALGRHGTASHASEGLRQAIPAAPAERRGGFVKGTTVAAQADGLEIRADIPVSGTGSNENGSMRRSRD